MMSKWSNLSKSVIRNFGAIGLAGLLLAMLLGLAPTGLAQVAPAAPNLNYGLSDGFETPALISQYQQTLGPLSTSVISISSAATGTAGIRFKGTQATGLFTPIDLSNPAHHIVLDTPSLWDGGGVIDPSAYVGSRILGTHAPGILEATVTFAYRIRQTGTTPAGNAHRQANMVFQWSTDGTTWTTGVGPTAATTTGVYRTTSFTSAVIPHTVETISITGLPGSGNQQLYFRFRWLCRLSDSPSSIHNFIDIDDFTVTPTLRSTAVADVNRDGIVNVVDAQHVINLLLLQMSPQFTGQGDVNFDSAIDALDVQAIINCIISGNC